MSKSRAGAGARRRARGREGGGRGRGRRGTVHAGMHGGGGYALESVGAGTFAARLALPVVWCPAGATGVAGCVLAGRARFGSAGSLALQAVCVARALAGLICRIPAVVVCVWPTQNNPGTSLVRKRGGGRRVGAGGRVQPGQDDVPLGCPASTWGRWDGIGWQPLYPNLRGACPRARDPRRHPLPGWHRHCL